MRSVLVKNGKTEKNKNNKRIGCDLFSVGFDWDNPRCKECGFAEKCKEATKKENYLISIKVQPKIPYSSKPLNQVPFLHVTKPVETGNEVVISLKFNKRWLRRLLKWDKEDTQGKCVKYLTKIREKIRTQFANRPEIIEELDKLLEGF